MMMMQFGVRCTILAVLVLLVALVPSNGNSDNSPIQVFLLAGQSNMVGMGSMKHMEWLIAQDDPPELRHTLWNATAFRTRCDVYVQYETSHGCLTLPGFAAKDHFGPEVGLGWVLGDYFSAPKNRNDNSSSSPIIFIKTAWGGKNLAIDFRPPLSGEGNYAGVKPVQYGWLYRQMILDIYDALSDLSKIYPSYNASIGYELAGFIWFQGWNDMLYEPFVDEYGFNLANFIRDVRRDLDAKDLPFVVGELGMHGLHPIGPGRDRVLHMRASQRNVTLLPEFVHTTMYVPTSPFVPVNDTTGGKYGGQYHYNGRADTYYYMGKAFGYAAIKLMEKAQQASREQ
jgi:hypothetical protein